MIEFLRRSDPSNYVTDQTVNITIGSGGGSDTDTVENVPNNPSTAIEVIIEGKRYVLLAYEVKD